MNDLITIIVPFYNVEKYLKECIESILKQTYKNLEIVLVDDGSIDNSKNICDEYKKKDNRIVVIHQPNGGISKARNTGLKHANGKYIQFVDGDDYIAPDMVELLYNNIKEKDADISICSHYIIKNGEIYTDAEYNKFEYSTQEALEDLLLDKKIRFYVWDKLFKSDLFKNIEYPEGRVFEDILTMPRIFNNAKKVVFQDIPKYYYRQREGSILHKQTVKLGIDYINAVLDMHTFLKNSGLNLENYINYNLANLILNTYNNAGIFNMPELCEEKKVQELFEKLQKMFNNKEIENFIMNNCTNVMKIHYYYLLEDKNGYIKNNKFLPLIYPEQDKK